jgi:CRP-like cAMP-binding protein
MSIAANPRENHLLAALPDEELGRLLPFLELIPLLTGTALYGPGEPMRYLYFPTDSIVSLQYGVEDGSSVEIAVVGNEGVVGMALYMGGETTLSQAIVQSSGSAYRLKGQVLMSPFDHAAPLQQLLLRYTQALLTQMAQRLVCNRVHSLDQQFCRWLLQYFDRLPVNYLRMTQELIASMLGVRRGGVSEMAGNLQRSGLISYSRGCITLLDRPGLERRSCECYAVVRNEFERLFPPALRATLLIKAD